MHMCDTWILLVRRGILEVYVLSDSSYQCWKTFRFPHTVGNASFLRIASLDGTTTTELDRPLRLCICCAIDLFVYDILCNPCEDIFSIRMLWRHRAPTDRDKSALAGGMLGATGRTISWLYGSHVRWEFPVKFAIARLPVHPGGSSTAISEWHDTHMPALHAQAVYDYDDARGVVVFGNAFGELSLYDFSGSDPGIFGSWLASKLVAPPREEQSLASTVCITINFLPHIHILIHT